MGWLLVRSLLIVALTAMATAAIAQNRPTRFWNLTRNTITQLYLAPAGKPDLLVLDEPFVSLDTALAARMRAELVELVSRQPVTTLLVTHSIEEAIEIADRVVLLSAPPARLLGDVRIANPRRNRTAAAFSAIRSEIENKINAVDHPAARC